MTKYDTSAFTGIFVALNTPYDAKGNVSPQAIREIARQYAKLGVTGMYACGSTGEGVLLGEGGEVGRGSERDADHQERQALYER